MTSEGRIWRNWYSIHADQSPTTVLMFHHPMAPERSNWSGQRKIYLLLVNCSNLIYSSILSNPFEKRCFLKILLIKLVCLWEREWSQSQWHFPRPTYSKFPWDIWFPYVVFLGLLVCIFGISVYIQQAKINKFNKSFIWKFRPGIEMR